MRSPREAGSQIAHRQKPEALAPAKEPEPKPLAPAKEPEPIAHWQKPEALAAAKEALVLAKAAKEPHQVSNEQKGCSLSCSIFWAIRSRCD